MKVLETKKSLNHSEVKCDKKLDENIPDKRQLNIVKALESNNVKLTEEVRSLKTQLSQLKNVSLVPENNETQAARQKIELLRNKILDLTSDNSKLKQKLSMQNQKL